MQKLLWLGLFIIIIASAIAFFPKHPPQDLLHEANTVSKEETPLPSEMTGTKEVQGTTSMEIATMTEHKTESQSQAITSEPLLKTTLVAGGCFWCVEADLEKLEGVQGVVSGYAEGTTPNPTYKNYEAGGHREVVEVTYDAKRVSFREIAIYAIKHMDPTDAEGSFYDRGRSYAPALYYENSEEKDQLEKLIAVLNEKGPYEKPLALLILPRPTFYPAEDYHQDYYKGTLSQLKYQYYRQASGRDDFIKKHWGTDTGPTLPFDNLKETSINKPMNNWNNYVKPSEEILKTTLDPLAFKVTQDEGTERAGTHPYDKNYEPGIYVDILSGEPLFSSRDKFDSGTGWPSFVKPIESGAVAELEDRRLFTTRTEIRSKIADNHLGHVFSDGPKDRGGMRYCMNGVALRFVPKSEMEKEGYGEWMDEV